jgi:hypothetical protein
MHQVAPNLPSTVAVVRDPALMEGGAPDYLRWCAAVCIVLMIAAAVFPRIQMLVGGTVPVPPAILKALLLFVLGMTFFARGARCTITPPVALCLFITLGLGISRAHILFSSHVPLGDLLFSDFLMYFVLLLGCIFVAVPMLVSPRLLTGLLFSVFFISLAIGAAQYFLNKTIIPTDSVDGNFSVLAWDFYGRVRAFGLFVTPMQFGFFCCLIGNFGIALVVRKQRRLLGCLLVVLAGFGCFVTFTRAAQICYCVGLPLAYIICTGRPKALLRVLPACALAMSVIVIGVGATQLAASNKADLSSSETLNIRLTEWKLYLATYGEMSLPDQILGNGLVERGGFGRIKHLANEGPTLLDNTYIAVLVNFGIVGVALVMGLYASAWIAISRKTAEGASPLMVATAATFATLPFLANYEVVLSEVGMFMLLANLLAF